ncbi:NAD-dependent epimerase/dehydratase family protein [Massilia sp. PAMC28688]|uniref:NAD-dependent epimerase/dehydratase family protein n=1 Tax=Massilia sp. PAMC28688 TaxID=2861283 RepID=UPI001C63B55E|nr:NAD-dependent epimerase/dehydratase family protein [Massilia sp. PAMC28688]QYF91770.1 NAD-dependent epimerase/dehydratase family protein [Massilia sp. PAMC28688]
MKVIIFGATGMVGQGALRECLAAPDVEAVLTVGRTPTGQKHPKLTELVHAEMWHYEKIEAELSDYDACFYCVGVSAAGLSEKAYTHLTYDMTLAVAATLARRNPGMVFVYVSAAGAAADGKLMWERVRGRTENAVFALPFRAAYAFRPGMIQPLDGIKSKTVAYRVFYSLTKPILPLLRSAMPRQVLTTRMLGQAMLAAVRGQANKRILESADLNELGRAGAA